MSVPENFVYRCSDYRTAIWVISARRLGWELKGRDNRDDRDEFGCEQGFSHPDCRGALTLPPGMEGAPAAGQNPVSELTGVRLSKDERP